MGLGAFVAGNPPPIATAMVNANYTSSKTATIVMNDPVMSNATSSINFGAVPEGVMKDNFVYFGNTNTPVNTDWTLSLAAVTANNTSASF